MPEGSFRSTPRTESELPPQSPETREEELRAKGGQRDEVEEAEYQQLVSDRRASEKSWTDQGQDKMAA